MKFKHKSWYDMHAFSLDRITEQGVSRSACDIGQWQNIQATVATMFFRIHRFVTSLLSSSWYDLEGHGRYK
jgi:hypothetical protein